MFELKKPGNSKNNKYSVCSNKTLFTLTDGYA